MTERFDDYALDKECKSIAQEIFDIYKDDYCEDGEEIDAFDHTLTDSVSEHVDGHEFVIYHHKALRFCAECDVSDGEEFLADIGLPHEITIHNLASTILYGEMESRVRHFLEQIVEEYNDSIED
jgi:hypothetical protein